MTIDLIGAKKLSHGFIAEIDPVELACRMLEASAQTKRPPGKTPTQCLLTLPVQDREDLMRCAFAAMEYWRECINEMKQTS